MVSARRAKRKRRWRFCFPHSAMGVRAAASAVPRVGTARARPRLRRGDARATSRFAPAVVSARSEDSGDPEPDAGDVGVGDDAALVVDPCKKTRASSSRSGATSISETTITALALVPPKTALDPLMCRLNARSRTLAYPALFGMTLELRQAWSEEAVGTGAAVWDAAAALADDLARDGAAVALSRWEGMRARGAEDRDAARHTTETVNVARVKKDARRWWRNKVVVELGAGLGAASLAAAALGARALATDGDEAVVTLCVENAVANEDAVVSTATRLASFLELDDVESEKKKNTVHTLNSPRAPACLRLVWGDDDDARAARAWVRAVKETGDEKVSSHPDAILLADVVYGENAAVWRSLVKTLKTLSGPNTVTLLSHARRGASRGAFEEFKQFARNAGFEVEAAETKSDTADGLLAVTVTYVMRRF